MSSAATNAHAQACFVRSATRSLTTLSDTPPTAAVFAHDACADVTPQIPHPTPVTATTASQDAAVVLGARYCRIAWLRAAAETGGHLRPLQLTQACELEELSVPSTAPTTGQQFSGHGAGPPVCDSGG